MPPSSLLSLCIMIQRDDTGFAGQVFPPDEYERARSGLDDARPSEKSWMWVILRHTKNKDPFMTDIVSEIRDLKAEHNATILAHYYQDGEIQALADVTGDSLKLAREATKVDSPVIVFCGALFMAETAKMLNPTKTVLLPDLQAGCSLVDACPADKLARYQETLRINGRQFQTVCYINSSATVKA